MLAEDDWSRAGCGRVAVGRAARRTRREPGQASLTIDDGAKAAYIVDLGGSGDGTRLLASRDGALLEGKPMLDYLRERGIEHLVITCSHPHSDHMGGIKALFRDPAKAFLTGGDPTRRPFKSVTVIDNGVTESLANLYRQFGERMAGSGLDFRHVAVTDQGGQPRNAYAELPFEQRDVRVSNVPYAQTEPADEHGRAVITLTELEPGTGRGILDTDDASTTAVESAVAKLKAQGVTAIDAFVVPHHGSRYHDSVALFELHPKRAIFSVNPDNRFGHPAAEVVEKLIDALGRENVYFTGSVGAVEIGPEGVKALHSAADPDTFALFFEQRLAKAETMRDTPERREEIAALKRVREKIAQAPRTHSGALDVMLAMRAHDTGTIHPAEFELGQVPPAGADAAVLTRGRPFDTPAHPAVYITAAAPLDDADKAKVWRAHGAADIRIQTGTGQPSPFFPDEPPPPDGAAPAPDPGPEPDGGSPNKPGRPGGMVRSQIGSGPLPDGGMVFLDGGRVAIASAGARLAGARLVPCRAGGPCLVTATGEEYRLPFADATLLGEVLWRVARGTDAFYLSINPRKRMLRADFPIGSVPADRLRFGPGRGGADALNEVVTTGGIDRSRIGDILWRADVGFKSKALGVDALTGARLPTDPRLFVSDESEGLFDDAVAEGDRWCRLYWGSGAPSFTFVAPPSAGVPGRIVVGGTALKAKAEAMRPRGGSLQRFPEGGWCAREKAVAAILQRQANQPATTGTLGELRTLAQMQSFALWAKHAGVSLTGLAAAPAPTAPIPGWTSGIRTANATLVKPERRILPDARGYMIHVWSSAPGAFACRNRTWAQLDQDFTRLNMPKHNGKWVVVPMPAVYAKLDTWLADASQRIARCAGGRVEPVLDNPDIELGKSGAMLGMVGHSLSSQLHGGVLLGETGAARAFTQAYGDDGALWAPDGTLLFKRIGEALHFWNPLPGGRGAQHVVVTSGTLRKIDADQGKLFFLVDAGPGSAIRSDLRAAGNEAGAGLEWMGLWHGADATPLAGKIAMRCAGAAAGCIDVHDADEDVLLTRLRTMGIEDPAIVIMPLNGGTWAIRLDVARLAATLRPPAEADADARIAAASELGRWGLMAEAEAVLADALSTLSPDAEDTILRSLIVVSDE